MTSKHKQRQSGVKLVTYTYIERFINAYNFGRHSNSSCGVVVI